MLNVKTKKVQKREELRMLLTAIAQLKREIGSDLTHPKLKGLLVLTDALTSEAGDFAAALTKGRKVIYDTEKTR